ncbi:hypothetical protein PP707_03165 [Acetobacter pasteurianus]|nr:hypothetical protein [Acetobacter pasteurianus]
MKKGGELRTTTTQVEQTRRRTHVCRKQCKIISNGEQWSINCVVLAKFIANIDDSVT